MTQKASSKIIVALDVPTKEQALSLVEQLRPEVSLFKIGLQLYTAEGPAIVRAIRDTGAKVFLDLKLHDIPNTVARAVESAAGLGVQMLTIHLSGGGEMIRAAAAAAPRDLLLLGVTLLTSMDEKTLNELGFSGVIDEQVSRLATLGVHNGINGLVASAHELKTLRKMFADKIKIVVPGIRPSGSDAGDQKRTMTPGQAIEAGADYLVIGRPITAAKSPREALEQILEEIDR